jgi:hypothetical protein
VADDADFMPGMLPPGQDPLHTDPPSGGIDYGTGALDTKPPPERGILGRTWDSIVNLPTGIVRSVEGREPDTGAPRFSFPDVPNIYNATGGFDALERANPIPMHGLPGQTSAADLERLQARQNLQSGLAMGARPEQLQQLLLAAYPDQITEASPDSHGNPMVIWNGKPHYVARPGFDLQDLTTLGGKATAGALAATGAGRITEALAAPGVVRALGQAAVQGGAQAGAEAGSGLAVQAAGGGGSGTTPQEIAMAGAFGGLGTLGGRIASSFWRSWRGTGQMLRSGIDAADTAPVTPEMLTTTGKQIFDNEGIDPTGMTVGQLRALNTRMADQADKLLAQQKRGMPGQPTGAGMMIRGERQGVPVSGGQASMDPGALWREHVLRAGGSGGRDIMQGFDTVQRTKLTEAAQAATGGTETTEQLGQTIGNRIAAAGKDLADKKDVAYAAFPRLTPQGEAALPNPIVFPQQTAQDLKTSLADIHAGVSDTPGVMPLAVRGRQVMDDLTAGPFNLGQVERARQDLGALLDQSKPGGTEFRLLYRMKRSLDDTVDGAVNSGQISGDPARIQMLKDARRANADLRDFWDPKNDNASQFMQKMKGGQLQGQQVYDALFSTKDLDAGGPLRDIVDHLTSKTGQNSGLLDDVRQAAMHKILFGDSGNAYEMNPQRMIDRINRHLSGRGEVVLRQLGLPVDDLKELTYLQQGLQAAQNPNRSGTATSLLAQRFSALLQRYPMVVGKMRDMVANVPEMQRQAALGATGAMEPTVGARLTPQMFAIPGRYANRPRVGAVGGGLLGGEGDQR